MDALEIRGARQHNLRDVSLRLPKNRLVVFTGVSGSGKSSFAFDTLYAEGQRRYVESLSSYARQFLNRTPKPDVDSISGLAPTISIEQRGVGHNPRSTVGTITEIYDYLRVLFSAIGKQHCHQCGKPIGAQTPDQIAARLLTLPDGARLHVLAPVARQRKGEFRDLFEDMLKAGYIRARVDGEHMQLTDDPQLDRQRRHNIEIVMDRGVVGRAGFSKADRSRLAEAVEGALDLGEGTLIANWEENGKSQDMLLSANYACESCNISLPPPSHASFSFNSPQGMCPTCGGLGTKIDFDPELFVANPDKSLLEGAIPIMLPQNNAWRRHFLEGVARHYKFTLDTPFQDLTKRQRQVLLHGSGKRRLEFRYPSPQGEYRHAGWWQGIMPLEMERYRRGSAPSFRKKFEDLMRNVVCPDCHGGRLKPESLAVRIGDASISDLSAMSIGLAQEFFDSLDLKPEEIFIAEDALKEIRGRLGFLMNVGLHYLALDRTAPTLAGGESQRIRLASQIGSGLVGVLYILDEPSIGLHNRDNARLLRTLEELRDRGNTVVVVEHDEDTMLAADHIVDFGPGAGERGGKAVVSGSLAALLNSRSSLTGQYLRGELEIPIPPHHRPTKGKSLFVRGAKQNNLRNIDVEFPLGIFICVTGVSGSGKSSLVSDILCSSLQARLNRAQTEPGDHRIIEGIEHLDKVIAIDQSPIGRTPRSNPATYVGVFDHIRSLMSQLPDSRLRAYKPGRFSFNVRGGRCEACEGNGSVRLKMDFLADVWVECEVCEGKRFNRETLEIEYKGKNISQILEMEIGRAIEHFRHQPKIFHMLETLRDVGMDYVRLGQPAPTLSGGEAQRVKLAKELCRRSTGRTLYILDEPTTGLHFADIQKLLDVLHRFVEGGNTVVVVEHNLEVVKTADYIIDLGPEGGEGGGRVVVVGNPKKVAAHKTSHTSQALRELLQRDRRKHSKAPVKKAGRKPKAAARMKHISVKGAREHNLAGISAKLPREKMSVFSGVSGSGKSSLALDTIYAEGQRRYIESLSSYARQFLGQIQKPRVDQVTGLSPAICIEQKRASRSPRSTVGTITEVYDYLRALYARLGVPHCPECNVPTGAQTSSQIISRILEEHNAHNVLLLAPVKPRDNEDYRDLVGRLGKEGFARIRLNGDVLRLDEDIEVRRRRRYAAELVIDRLKIGRRQRTRLAEAVESALDRSGGTLVVADSDTDEEISHSRHSSCSKCGAAFEALTPRGLGFNHADGWCRACDGLGTQLGADPRAVVPDKRKTLRNGAIRAWGPLTPDTMLGQMMEAVAAETDLDLDTPWQDQPVDSRNIVLYGTEDRWFSTGTLRFQFKGLFPSMEEAVRLSWRFRHTLGHIVRDQPCRECGGGRLNPAAAAVRLRGKTLPDLCDVPLEDALAFAADLTLSPREREMAGEILDEVLKRLRFLVDVGLEYVTLGRSAPTLSGGESQRIRLAGQIGSGLTGVLYVLDEPTIGLHPRDNARLLEALKRLRDLGNTLVVVEHDRDTLEAADYLLDFGPGAGPHGGHVVASGTPAALKRRKNSLTGQYLSDALSIPIPTQRRKALPIPRGPIDDGTAAFPGWLSVVGARHNNLRNITVHLPLGRFICVTGPSGSGKSSLVNGILYRSLAHELNRARTVPEEHDRILGIEQVEKLVNIDQTPIGRSPRSNAGTYTGVFDRIRKLFSMLPEAKVRGYTTRRFSYNQRSGQCRTCRGHGSRCIEMHFLPDVWVECESCHGARFNNETLAIRYRGKSIADILAMPIEEACDHFARQPLIRRQLQALLDVGLGYMQLGQPATTLSGGEAQRVKLAGELARPQSGKSLYLLDEPTTGLHIADVDRLLRVLNRLVEEGNTILVIEHNIDVVKAADWIVDLGPGGGDNGGSIVSWGTPEKVARSKRSPTAPFLASALKRSERVPREELVLVRQQMADLPKDDALAGKEVKRPWEVDGRKWHLYDRRTSGGKTPAWQGEALASLVDKVAAFDGMGAVKWNSRDAVTLKAEAKRAAYFMRARTNEYWWFRVEVRTAKGLFTQEELSRSLALPVWSNIPELQVYGNWQRVHIRTRHKKWDTVHLFLWNQVEIASRPFQAFLKQCYAGYRRQLGLEKG